MSFSLHVQTILGSLALLAGSASAANLSGNAFLSGQSDHSGITVSFESLSVPALSGLGGLALLALASLALWKGTNSCARITGMVGLVLGLCATAYAAALIGTATTNAAGAFTASVPDGIYDVLYSRADYHPWNLPGQSLTGAATLPPVTLIPTTGPSPTPFLAATATPTETEIPLPTETPTNTPIPAGSLFATDSIVGNLRYVPAGTFTQGSDAGEAGRISDETPFSHTLTRNLAVMETEVTRQMWADLEGAQGTLPTDPSYTGTGFAGSTNPVQYNTWYESVLFANLLSVQQGLPRAYYTDEGFTTPIDSTNYTGANIFCNWSAAGYRLPSEGEWEYLARGETTTPFSATVGTYNSGNYDSCTASTHPALEAIAWFCGNASGTTHVVGGTTANPWNLKDVHGNVWEWCWDWYGAYPVGSQNNYTGPASVSNRVMRGGSWSDLPNYCRSAFRDIFAPSSRSWNVGFRLVRTLGACLAGGPTCTPTSTPTLTPTDTPTLTPTQTPSPTNTPAGTPGSIYATDPFVGNLRLVPPGTFTQGSDAGEAGRDSDETQFSHTVSHNLAVMETEITRQMWADLEAAQGTLPTDPSYTGIGFEGSTNPVQNNTWYESVLFANLLSVQQGLTRAYYTDEGFTTPIDSTNYTGENFSCNWSATGYRLPSEGEWEYLARAGTTTPFSATVGTYNSGNYNFCTASTHPALEAIAWFCGNATGTTHAVGGTTANPWNLKDVHGNVAEWCWDWYGTYPVGSQNNYTGQASVSFRVVRGGSWGSSPDDCRSADRNFGSPTSRDGGLGFRLVRTVN